MKTISQASPKHMGFRGLCSMLALTILGLAAVTIPADGALTSKGGLGQGILGFLRSLEEETQAETEWFYRHFGKSVDPAKLNAARNCHSGTDKYSEKCAPAVNPHAPTANPNLPAGAGDAKTRFLAAVAKEEGRSSSVPSKCLEDPDDPDCRGMRQLVVLPGLTGFKNGDG
ncbi:MAG: hypothetical protein SGILL_006324, partial [Bacillariaceae sp.]